MADQYSYRVRLGMAIAARSPIAAYLDIIMAVRDDELGAAKQEVARLQGIIDRHDHGIMPVCEGYMAARAEKAEREVARLQALLDGQEVADDEPDPEPGFETVTAHLGELRPTACPKCGSDDLLAAKIYGLTASSSRVMGEMAVCHGCGWSPFENPDEVTVRREDLDLVMNGAGDATRMAGWADACQRIRDALEGAQRG